MHLLVVDDDAIMLDVYKRAFNYFNITSDCVTSGSDAIEKYKKNMKIFDFIITDYQMPKMNGVEFARAIKEINKNIGLLLVTGNDMEKPVEFVGMMTKPVLISELIQKVLDCCKK